MEENKVTYEIIIKKPPVEGNTEGLSPTPSNGISTQKGGSVASGSQINKTDQALKAASLKVATQVIQSVSQIYIANKTTEISVLTGSNQLAQRQQVTNWLISTGTNIATGVLQGAAAGSLLGPIGSIGGAAIGAVTAAIGVGISKATEVTINKNRLQIENAAEQQEIDYMRDRAGLFYSQSR